MEQNVDRGMWSVVALLAAIVIGGVILYAYPRITANIANNLDKTMDETVDSTMPDWAANPSGRNLITKSSDIYLGDLKGQVSTEIKSNIEYTTKLIAYNGEDEIFVRTETKLFNVEQNSQPMVHTVRYYDKDGKVIDTSTKETRKLKPGERASETTKHKANAKAKAVRLSVKNVTPTGKIALSYNATPTTMISVPGDDIFYRMSMEPGYIAINTGEVIKADASNLTSGYIDVSDHRYIAVMVESKVDETMISKNNGFFYKSWIGVGRYTMDKSGTPIFKDRPASFPGIRENKVTEIGESFYHYAIFDVSEARYAKISARYIDNVHSKTQVFLFK